MAASIVGNGLVEHAPVALIPVAPVEQGIGIVRLEIDRIGKIGDRALVQALVGMGNAADVVGEFIVRPDADGAGGIGNGQIAQASRALAIGAVGIVLGEIRQPCPVRRDQRGAGGDRLIGAGLAP